jgi:hypothetical protein
MIGASKPFVFGLLWIVCLTFALACTATAAFTSTLARKFASTSANTHVRDESARVRPSSDPGMDMVAGAGLVILAKARRRLGVVENMKDA